MYEEHRHLEKIPIKKIKIKIRFIFFVGILAMVTRMSVSHSDF